MTRVRRKIIATLSINLLLFAQLAVAAYVCPGMNSIQYVGKTVVQKITTQPCYGMDSLNPPLCKQHCEQSAQSVDSRIQTEIDLSVFPVLWITSRAIVHAPARWFAWKELPPDLVGQPLYLHHCRFLI
ncbi:MAG: hypothetical protein HYX63_06030 [Gammaproteobacteria bacterium]|nr:hypothetical protein [Gammaproteobacteria bacterium]